VQAATAVDAAFDGIAKSLANGDEVSIDGRFDGRFSRPRTGRNPKTGEEISAPVRTLPIFGPATSLRNAVNAP
jgi:DNA-binding protein HU-beta